MKCKPWKIFGSIRKLRSQMGDYSLVILDELSLALHLNLIPESEVLGLIQQRPQHIDMILTGPNMPSSLMDVADQITEMRRSVCP